MAWTIVISREDKRRILEPCLSTEEGRERIVSSFQKVFPSRYQHALGDAPYPPSRPGGEFIELVQEWEREEAVAFKVARAMLGSAFDVFSDHEFVQEREAFIRMCPWGSSELIDVDELLATFSWYKGPVTHLIYRLPDGIVEVEKPTKAVKSTEKKPDKLDEFLKKVAENAPPGPFRAAQIDVKVEDVSDGLVDEEKPTKVVKPTKTWAYNTAVQSMVEERIRAEEQIRAERYLGVELIMKNPKPDLGLQVTWTEREPSPEISPHPRSERKMKIGVDVTSD